MKRKASIAVLFAVFAGLAIAQAPAIKRWEWPKLRLAAQPGGIPISASKPVT